MAKTRFNRSTKGENAEVIVSKAVAYTTQATVALFQTNAVPGEIGVYNADTNALIGGVAVLAAPANPQVSTNTVGGAVPAQTSYYKIVAYNAAGNSGPSTEVSVVSTGSTSSNLVSWSDVPGATSYRIYRGTATNTQTGYQTTSANSFLDQSATAGTVGTVPAAAGSVAAPMTAGTKYFVALMRQVDNFGTLQNSMFKTATITYDPNRTRRTDYIAPVKQVTTITFSAAFVTYTNTLIAAQIPFSITDNVNYAGITTIETTPGNEPYPTLDWDYEFDNPAGVTVNTILTNIVAQMNNPLDLKQKDDGQQYSAVLSGNDGAGYTVTITAYYFQQHFRVALRGLLSAGSVVYTTGFKQGVGDSSSVSSIEQEGFIYQGVTTNYPGMGVPDEYGKPTPFTVAGLTYVTYQLDPLRVSKEPNPHNVWHYWAHIYVIVPVPVGGSAGARASSSPDYILGSALGFTLTP